MIQDIPFMTRDEIYSARYEIAGLIAQSRGIQLALERDMNTRVQGNALRRELDVAEDALFDVIRPK
jgi:hypothetical protein